MQAPNTKFAESAGDQTFHWRRFFHLALRVLGVGLLASGIVTLIAANWDGLSQFQRIAGVQGLLVVVTLIALFLVWHGHRQRRKPLISGNDSVAGVAPYAGALFLASVAIGGLLALLGQTYQTGADPWTLFGWWAVLMLPWLWASRSWFLAVLWLVVLNTAMVLLLADTYLEESVGYPLARYAWLMACLNAGLLVVAEGLRADGGRRGHYSDPYRVVPRLLALAVLVALFATVAMYVEGMFQNGFDPLMILQGVLVAAVVAAGMRIYYRIRPDFFILSQLAVFTVLYVGVYALALGWLLTESLEFTFALGFVCALISLWACLRWLQRVYRTTSGHAGDAALEARAANPAVSESAEVALGDNGVADTQAVLAAGQNDVANTSAVTQTSSPFLFLFSFLFLFLLGSVLVVVLEIPLFVAGAAFLLAGLVAYVIGRRKWPASCAVIMLVSLLLLGAAVFDGHYEVSTFASWPVLLLIAGLIALYHFYRVPWYQFLCAVSALVMFSRLWPLYSPFSSWGSGGDEYRFLAGDWRSGFMLELTPIFVLAGTLTMMALPAAWARRYRVFALALLVLPLWFYLLYGNEFALHAGADAAGAQNLLGLSLSKWQLPASNPLLYVGNLIFALLPVVVAWRSAHRHRVPPIDQLIVLLVLLALGVLWGDLPGVQLGLLFCVLGFDLGRRNMTVIGVVSVIVFLAHFYYQLNYLLLDKAYFLIAQAAVLLLVAFLWMVTRPLGLRERKEEVAAGSVSVDNASGLTDSGSSASVANHRLEGREASAMPVAAAIVLGLAAVLAVANTDIAQKEAIIRDGTRFIVALQPVDPRSLMQGDYMRLNFASRSGDDAELFSDNTHHYVELAPDASGVYAFSRTMAELAPPSAPGNVVVRYRKTGRNTVKFVTDAYFFPEGKGEHFAKAKFGEFRVNDKGVALLTGLLDENQNRL